MISAAVGILLGILVILVALFLYIVYTDKHIEQVFEAMKQETYNPRPAAQDRHGVPRRRRFPALRRCMTPSSKCSALVVCTVRTVLTPKKQSVFGIL